MKLAVAEFSDYALVWWNKNQREMMRKEGREIDTWTEIRRVMQKRYVLTSYNKTMRQKLQRLSQGSLAVDEYYKEMSWLKLERRKTLMYICIANLQKIKRKLSFCLLICVLKIEKNKK